MTIEQVYHYQFKELKEDYFNYMIRTVAYHYKKLISEVKKESYTDIQDMFIYVMYINKDNNK